MNNEEIKVKPEKKKKHFPFWIILLLLVVVYALGILTGLKLSTMDAPFNVVEKFFPAEQVTAADISESPLPATAQAPAETPASVNTPIPTVTPKPTETPAPAETETPVEKAPEEEITFADEIVPELVEVAAPAKAIGIDSSVEAAMNFKGLNPAETEVTGVYRDESAGIAVYAVELAADGKEYRFDVNAFSGDVEGWRQLRGVQPDIVQIIMPETQAHENSASVPQPDEIIQAELAQEFALMHAGVKQNSAKEMGTKLVDEGGTWIYTVEFNSNGYHYTYRIDADNGDVLGFSKTVG